MILSEIKRFVEYYYDLDLSFNSRETKYIHARALYYNFSYSTKKYSKSNLARSLGFDHSSVIHSINNFDIYMSESPVIERCLDLLKQTRESYKSQGKNEPQREELSKPIEKAVKILSEMTDLEVIEFLPRIELYHKSNINKRQRQEQWQQQKLQQA